MMKRLLLRFSPLAVAAVLLASMAASAANATGTVSGSVTQSGNPIAGAKVVIDSESDSSYGAATETDAKGGFSFTGAPLGAVNLRVYDANDQLAVSGKGELTFQNQVITVTLEITP
jgi:hypothetical protein